MIIMRLIVIPTRVERLLVQFSVLLIFTYCCLNLARHIDWGENETCMLNLRTIQIKTLEKLINIETIVQKFLFQAR